MEEINSLIFHGCKLARDLESNLPNLVNQPTILSKLCDDIIRIFSAARDRLNAQGSTSSGPTNEPQISELGGVEDWLRYNCTQAMGLLQAQILAETGLPESGTARSFPSHELEGSRQFRGGGGEVQAKDVSDSGRASSSQRPRRRKNDVDRRTVMMPAPRMGNTEMPPEDGYIWRKYGQKEILGSTFPRGYYRCTHQKLYKCPAKKQVQRLDNDPYTFEVIYRGEHICHMSSTAPSVPPISSEIMPQMTQQATTAQSPPPPPAASNTIGRWLSMDIKSAGEGTSTYGDPQMQIYGDFGVSATGAGTSGGLAGGSGGAGPSTVQYERDVDYPLQVADFADTMFNSGSSSNNSMDLIFSSVEDKGEPGDKKN